MGTIDTLLRVKADASQAVKGLQPLQASLQDTAADAAKTEQALDTLDGQHKINLNDEAIESARTEMERLRNLMREQLRVDPTVDTKEAQRQIAQLQRSIKLLEDQQPQIEVDLVADTAGLAGTGRALSEFASTFTGDITGEMLGNLQGASTGLKAMGATGAASAAGVGSAAVAAAGAAKAFWDLGQAAADVETSVSQLNALTGGLGADTFAALQEWASTTPFAMDDATEATKRLVAAGVDLQDIPDYLNDIGNTAFATGVPLSQIATVFAQMESKGRATYEELQQLAEAGIPVWSTLAQKLGLTVAEVQALATEGKLTAETVTLVREALNQQFPTAMADGAETFNGKMSTLRDTLTTTGQEAGTLFLPVMKDAAVTMQEVADEIGSAVGWLVKLNAGIRETSEGGTDLVQIFGGVGPTVVRGLNEITGANEDAAAAEKERKDETDALAASVRKEIAASEDAANAAADHADQMTRLADVVDRTGQRYDDLMGSFTAFHDDLVDARSNVYDYHGALDDLATSLAEGNTFSPDLQQGEDNWNALVGLAEAASARVQDTWEKEGKDAAVAQQRTFRQAMADMLMDAGVGAQRAWELVNDVLKEPHQIRVELGEIDTAKLKASLARLREKRAAIEIPSTVGLTPRAIDELTADYQRQVKPIDAKIDAKVGELRPAKDDLDDAANPDGKPRKAKIDAKVDPNSLADANEDLNNFIRLRRSSIKLYVDVVPPETGAGGLTAPSALRGASAGLLAATPSTTGAWTPTLGGPTPRATAGRPQTTRLAPKQTPIAVYLDGAVIADRLEARRAMAAVESVRRTA